MNNEVLTGRIANIAALAVIEDDMPLRIVLVPIDDDVALFQTRRIEGNHTIARILDEPVYVDDARLQFRTKEITSRSADLRDRLHASFRAVIHPRANKRLCIVKKTAGCSDFRRRIHVRPIEDVHDFCNVISRLLIGRHALVLLYSIRPRIIGGERHLDVPAEIIELLLQVSGAALDTTFLSICPMLCRYL